MQLRVASCELQLRVASCELQVASCELRVASCELRVVSCELRVASCVLRVASCSCELQLRVAVASCNRGDQLETDQFEIATIAQLFESSAIAAIVAIIWKSSFPCSNLQFTK